MKNIIVILAVLVIGCSDAIVNVEDEGIDIAWIGYTSIWYVDGYEDALPQISDNNRHKCKTITLYETSLMFTYELDSGISGFIAIPDYATSIWNWKEL